MATLVFIHGLNTYGDDDIHIGPLRFGAMHARLEKRFRDLGHGFHAPQNLGAGSPEEMAEAAARQVREFAPRGPIHLLGQSTGGLVARAMAAREEFRERIASIITWGTPHQGTIAAHFAIEFARRRPGLARVFKTFGYDTGAKGSIFAHYTPEAQQTFNTRFPQTNERSFSLVCEVNQADLSWPLGFFHSRLHPEREASDGFVWRESQTWGNARGPFRLDHFGELGFFPHLRLSARRRAEIEFERLISEIDRIVSN